MTPFCSIVYSVTTGLTAVVTDSLSNERCPLRLLTQRVTAKVFDDASITNVCYYRYSVHYSAVCTVYTGVHVEIKQSVCGYTTASLNGIHKRCLLFRPRRMHEMQTIVIDDQVAWASVSLPVCLSVTRATNLTHLPDGDTSFRSLLHYCSHLF